MISIHLSTEVIKVFAPNKATPKLLDVPAPPVPSSVIVAACGPVPVDVTCANCIPIPKLLSLFPLPPPCPVIAIAPTTDVTSVSVPPNQTP